MKKYRNLALIMAICLTAVFYSACGGSNEKYDTAPSLDQSNGIKQNQSKNASPQAVQEAPALEYEYSADEDVVDVYNTNSNEYSEIIENGFINTADEAVSTFSIDVDTASYSNIRRMIQEGYPVSKDAVRIEEMINYFSYDYAEPTDGAPFSVTTELTNCPWNADSQLMLVGLQADKIDMENRPPMNLVFLIDVSGSMYGDDRLGLVQKAVNMLAENLNADDRISIVTYAGYESVLLEGASGSDTSTIINAINNLEAGGSTAGEAGIKKAYEIAEKYFIQGGNNRILLATDGDLNVGVSSSDELKSLVEKERDTGVNLSVLGFGYGNYKDDRLETLADNGNGNYAYIDSELEARKVLVSEMGGTLYTVAKDVKLQLSFDPENVQSYRLIGYENRVLANEDFNNDKVDAGEIGAGHSVTALYEIIPSEDLVGDHLMTLAMRYKEPDGEQSILKEYPVSYSECRTDSISKNSAMAAAVTEFGMLLRHSAYAGNASYSQIQELLSQTDVEDEYRREFVQLIELASQQGLLSYTATAPVETDDSNITTAPLEETEESVEYIVNAFYHGNQVDFPDPESFISMTKLYQEQAVSAELADTADQAIADGIYVEIAPADDPKNIFIFLIDDENEQFVIAYDDDVKCYAFPKVLKDELLIRMQASAP